MEFFCAKPSPGFFVVCLEQMIVLADFRPNTRRLEAGGHLGRIEFRALRRRRHSGQLWRTVARHPRRRVS
jgi:hypothetical protein